MRKLRIVTDSSSDIQALQYADFAYSPMKLIAGEREFVDGESLNVDEMVDFFGQYKGISRSSCPNVADWLEAFGEADDILCVTITSALSGSYNTACAAKSVYEAENEGKECLCWYPFHRSGKPVDHPKAGGIRPERNAL